MPFSVGVITSCNDSCTCFTEEPYTFRRGKVHFTRSDRTKRERWASRVFIRSTEERMGSSGLAPGTGAGSAWCSAHSDPSTKISSLEERIRWSDYPTQVDHFFLPALMASTSLCLVKQALLWVPILFLAILTAFFSLTALSDLMSSIILFSRGE